MSEESWYTMTEQPWCMTCGENPESTDETHADFIRNHTEESCPAGDPAIKLPNGLIK